MMPGRTLDISDDPLTRALKAEIEQETEAEQQLRLKKEKEARRVSETIDELIKEEKAALKRTRPVKILLLGQSESGKSTALKNFQIIHTPQAWTTERLSWRAVIQLNLIRSLRMILEALNDTSTPQSPRRNSRLPDLSQSPEPEPLTLTSRHFAIQENLRPLLQVEELLMYRLAPDNETDEPTTHLLEGTPRFREISVNALSSWKSVLYRLVNGDSKEGHLDDPNDGNVISQVIASRKEDIGALWTDLEIRAMLKKKKLRVEDLPGFFLDDLERIASVNYVPTDEDILRARLKTVGVTEYRFTRETPNVVGSDWRIYDVGGSRTQRAAWTPYFQDVDAIIFLAPISCFDQVLVEDPTVNRLEDTVILWKQVCSNPLLKNCNLILFMNKTDLLARKLQLGVKLSRYIPSYGNRPNDFTNTSAYLQRKFQLIFQEQSPEKRPFYCHMTALTDIHASARVIASVADMVFQAHLRDNQLI